MSFTKLDGSFFTNFIVCFNAKFLRDSEYFLKCKIMYDHVCNYCHTIKIVYFTLYLIEILSRTMYANDFYKV